MTENSRGPVRAVGHGLAQIIVGIYVVVDTLIAPAFRPFMRWLSGLHLVKTVEAWIAGLPPTAVLILFAVPLAVEEVAKFYGLVLMGGGHFKFGLIVYVGAHVFAILVCERIFHAGKDKLMTFAWFAKLFRWLEAYKNEMLTWVRGTALYRQSLRLKATCRQAIVRFKDRTRTAFGR